VIGIGGSPRAICSTIDEIVDARDAR